MSDDPVVDRLIGKSAGKIAMSNLPPGNPVLDAIADSAGLMWENLMSAWTLLEVWVDWSTVWRSPEGNLIAVVSPDGVIRREHILGPDDFE
jgi:hypothetical protein